MVDVGSEEANLQQASLEHATLEHPALSVRSHRAPGSERVGDAEREAMLRLASGDGVGPVAIAALRSAFGSAAEALAASALAWSAALGWAAARVERARATALGTDVRRLLADGRRCGARPILVDDAEYPALLRAIPDPPPVLWISGCLEACDDWSIAVVGSRRCSAYGLDQAAAMARGLVEHGHTVVSGGARGIDAEAHRAALRAGGRTIAVLGSGCGCPYPPEHAPLFAQIAECGAVVSEHAPMTEARGGFFPRRNRIIAGLAIAVLLVEARARSGASITARLAVEDLGRDVLAVPGRVDMPTSEGTHRAIREGWAALVTSAADVIEHLRDRGAPAHLIAGARHAHGSGGSVHTDASTDATSNASTEASTDASAAASPDASPDASPAASPAARPAAGLGVRAIDARVAADAATRPLARTPPCVPCSAIARRIGLLLRDRGALPLDLLVEAMGDGAGQVLAELTMLEVLGHVRRNSDGQWEGRAEFLAAAVRPP